MRRALLALAVAVFASPVAANTLIDNVNGIQVGADGKLARFRALLIGDDGRVIRTIGPNEFTDIDAQRRIDGQGRTLLPGLVDAHGHITQLGQTTTQLALNGVESLGSLKERLADFAAQHPRPRWILGRGWNEEIWTEKRVPTAADLDAVVPDRPILLYRVDGHAAVANSAALREAGITRDTPNPQGGEIGRDSAGKPNGFLLDTARQLVEAEIPPLSDAEYDTQVLAGQQILLAHGVTALAHMRTTAEDWASLNRLAASGQLQLRTKAYAFGLEALRSMGVSKPTPWLHGDRLRLGGVKFYTDGALGSRGAWLKKPYADAAGSTGLSLHSDAELVSAAGSAAGQGFQVAVHAIGDAANAQALRIFEALGKTFGGDRRWRIEHAQIIDPADIPRFARVGAIASMQPIHQVSDRTMAEARLGPHGLGGAYAWQSMLKSGGLLALGSDTPFDTPNPFFGLAAAISRQDMEGQPPGGWIPSERLTFEQALHGYTRGAAYAGFAEDRIGALEPGKWADFILVDVDPTKVDAQTLARTQVLETWIAGKKVWERPATPRGERGR